MPGRPWSVFIVVGIATLLWTPWLLGQPVEPAPSIQLTYLGTAGWEIQDGNVTVLVDPYISRLKYGGHSYRETGTEDEAIPKMTDRLSREATWRGPTQPSSTRSSPARISYW